jgi:hypothetical protein
MERERRKSPRFDIECPVAFKGEDVEGEGVLRDLSREGGQIEGDKLVNEGAYLELTLSLPGVESPVKVELAAVRWNRGRAFGVQFMYVAPEEFERISKFVDKIEFEASYRDLNDLLNQMQQPGQPDPQS